MTTAAARFDGYSPATLWFLISRAGHLCCGRWSLEDDARLRCACGSVLYLYQQPADGTESGAPAPPGPSPRGREERMTPAETAGLTALVAAMCPSMRLEETTTDAWHLLLADLDVADTREAVTRLGRRQSHIDAADIRAEVHEIREERLARDPLPLPDTDPDDPHRYRAELLALVTAIASGQRVKRAPAVPAQPPPALADRSRNDLRVRALRVPCPWCRAAAGRPCTIPRLGIPLKNAPAHTSRLIAAGPGEREEREEREERGPGSAPGDNPKRRRCRRTTDFPRPHVR
ncbi:zinc finger domain-containing protein [Streptomyces prasinus]|uniref:zinc finger domain-containing protein n=1 Tax=Streptomyces prasinus TaxID=67345 RepID=UPI002F420E6D